MLLVGGDSEIGAAAFTQLRSRGRKVVATTRRPATGTNRLRFDLNDPLQTWNLPPGIETACILAAVSRPSDCAADPISSAHTNVTRTLAVAERLIADGIHVLFVSSDQVFGGCTPYMPADAPTAPVSEYGRQKARAERALRAHMVRGAPVAILRLSKVLSTQTAFLCDWVRGFDAGNTVRVLVDKTMAPVPIAAVVEAIDALSHDRACGVFQLSGPRDISYVDAARHAAGRLGADESLIACVTAASVSLPLGSAPLHTTLDSKALLERYGIMVPDALDVLDQILDRIELHSSGERRRGRVISNR